MAKRSIITHERLQELKHANAIYVITCGIAGCTCQQQPVEGRCRLGFFSLFIQVVYGIRFAQRAGLPYHVDFSNLDYCYTDLQADKGPNFWNYYFKQPIVQLADQRTVPVINELLEIYPLRIWDKHHLCLLHKHVVQHLVFQDEVKSLLVAQQNRFKDKNILGVQVRGTDHAREVEPVTFQTIKKAIVKRIAAYDGLFVATDDEHIVNQLKKDFGSKLMYNQVVRSNTGTALHTNASLANRYQLGLDVLLDCYSLALCDHALLVHSNISYSALLFNPHLSYTLLETRRTKLKKWKTMLAYYLNQWGIRKW